MKGEIIERIAEGLQQIRRQKPLIHHITNYVSINDCANVTLAIGGSPIMANDPDEVAEVVAKSAALVLNLGTPNTRMLDSMVIAAAKANELGVPVVLDPVGVGFTGARIRAWETLRSAVRFSAIRGNVAEIAFIAGMNAGRKGIDAAQERLPTEEIVNAAAQAAGCIVAATGVIDHISDGRTLCRIDNGHPLLAGITGTGCMTSSLVAAACAAMPVSIASVAAGVLFMGIAGEQAAGRLRTGEGTGTFRIRLMDAVSCLEPSTLLERGKIKVEQTKS